MPKGQYHTPKNLTILETPSAKPFSATMRPGNSATGYNAKTPSTPDSFTYEVKEKAAAI